MIVHSYVTIFLPMMHIAVGLFGDVIVVKVKVMKYSQHVR